MKIPFKEHVSKIIYFDCLKASRKRENLNILPIDAARECWHIGQGSRQSGIKRGRL
jgi:hypothetical protein